MSMSLCMRMIHIFSYTRSTKYNCERLFFISTPFATKTVYSLSNRIIISISIFNMYSAISTRFFTSFLTLSTLQQWSKKPIRIIWFVKEKSEFKCEHKKFAYTAMRQKMNHRNFFSWFSQFDLFCCHIHRLKCIIFIPFSHSYYVSEWVNE